MFDFLKKLFGSPTPSFGMGSLPSPADGRKIDIARVQVPVDIPDIHVTDLSMFDVENQGNKPKCVGETGCLCGSYYIFNRTGKIVRFDSDKLYAECKKEDGIPYLDGTYATVMAKIVTRDGLDQYNMDSNDKFANGYAFVDFSFESIAQAIYQNGVLAVGMHIGSDWFSGIIGRTLRYIGGHETVFHGYSRGFQRLYGRNSWGIGWIGRIAGVLDSRVKQGHYVANYADIKDSFIDIIAFVPIPKEILDEVKNTGYRFFTTMKLGSSGYEVKKLQEKLGIPADGSFGPNTKNRVMQYQSTVGLIADGVVGPACRAKLNVGSASLIPQLAKVMKTHEGFFPGSRSYRNNSPANFKLGSAVLSEYMKKLGATGLDGGNFVIFPTLEIGTKAQEQFLRDCCSDKLTRYRSTMTIAQFVTIYAPASENDTQKYINQVTTGLGVGRSLQIKELL